MRYDAATRRIVADVERSYGVICPHFGTCGGCVSQDVPYPLQLERKQFTLDGLLRDALGGRAPAVRPVIGMRVDEDGMPWRFRHKAAFVFGEDPRNPRALVMGHFAAGSQRIVPVETCPVHGERANRLAFALRDQLVKARIPAAGTALEGILRHVVIRTSQDETEAVVMLVVTRNDKSLRRPLRAFLAAPDPPTGLLVNVHYRPGPYMVGDETIRIAGRASIRENALGPAFLVSPTAFFQTNPEAAGALLTEVATQVGDADAAPVVADLYAGSGLFAIPLALRGHTVVAIEENVQAVRDGEANARVNRVAPGHAALRARPRGRCGEPARAHTAGCRGAGPSAPGLRSGGDPQRVRGSGPRARHLRVV